MFTKKGFKIWLIIGVGSLGVLGVILLLQYHGRKQPITSTEPSSMVQTPPKTQRRWVAPPSTKLPTMKTPQQGVQTDPSQSKKLETIPMNSDASETEPDLEKKDTIHSLVDALSDGDIEVLKGLKPSIKDFLSDEELEKLDREIAESLREFVDLVPKVVDHKAKLGEIIVYTNNLAKQKNWHQDKEMVEEISKNNELINEMLDELNTLRSQASDLESTLLDSDFDSIGPQRDKQWIQRLGEDVWNNRGWPPEYIARP